MSSLGGLVGGVTHKLDNPLTSLTIALRGHRREVGHVLETLEAYEALGDSILEMVEEDPELLQRAPGLKGVVEQLASIREKQRERASKGKPPLADSLEGYLAAAKRGLDRIGEVVSRLRVYSRTDQFAELEKIDLKDGFEAGVDINEVIRRTLEHLDIEGTQRRHRIEVETRFNHEAPRIRCNPRLLADVIANLVSNAVDAVVERLGHESFEPEGPGPQHRPGERSGSRRLDKGPQRRQRCDIHDTSPREKTIIMAKARIPIAIETAFGSMALQCTNGRAKSPLS